MSADHRTNIVSSLEASKQEAVYAYLRQVATERLELKPEILDRMAPDTAIVEGLQLDSLAQVTLTAAIEDDLGVILEPEDRENLQTVGDLVRVILERSSRGVTCH